MLKGPSTMQLKASHGTESWAHTHHQYTCGLKRSCTRLFGYGKECASWLVNFLIQFDFFICQQLHHCSPWKHVLATEDKNYCCYPFCSLERGHLYFVLWTRITLPNLWHFIASKMWFLAPLCMEAKRLQNFLTSFWRCLSPSPDFRESLQWPDFYFGSLSSVPKIQSSTYWIAHRCFLPLCNGKPLRFQGLQSLQVPFSPLRVLSIGQSHLHLWDRCYT